VLGSGAFPFSSSDGMKSIYYSSRTKPEPAKNGLTSWLVESKRNRARRRFWAGVADECSVWWMLLLSQASHISERPRRKAREWLQTEKAVAKR
jgi:hypothetical protein